MTKKEATSGTGLNGLVQFASETLAATGMSKHQLQHCMGYIIRQCALFFTAPSPQIGNESSSPTSCPATEQRLLLDRNQPTHGQQAHAMNITQTSSAPVIDHPASCMRYDNQCITLLHKPDTGRHYCLSPVSALLGAVLPSSKARQQEDDNCQQQHCKHHNDLHLEVLPPVPGQQHTAMHTHDMFTSKFPRHSCMVLAGTQALLKPAMHACALCVTIQCAFATKLLCADRRQRPCLMEGCQKPVTCFDHSDPLTTSSGAAACPASGTRLPGAADHHTCPPGSVSSLHAPAPAAGTAQHMCVCQAPTPANHCQQVCCCWLGSLRA